LAVLAIAVVPSLGQIHLFLEEQEITLKDARSWAWVFPVARDMDEALDDLREYTKDRSDVRMRKDGENLMIAEKVSIPTIATKRGDLVGKGFITENYYAVALIFQLGYDISVNSQEWSVEMNNFRNYARDFMSYHYEQSYTRRIDALEKEIKALEREINQNDRKMGNMSRKISNLNTRISKETEEAKIAEYQEEITTLEADIQVINDATPQINSEIQVMQGNVEKLKTESHTFQTAIGSI
jgi:phage host-nuclease inhibitor protein Gam